MSYALKMLVIFYHLENSRGSLRDVDANRIIILNGVTRWSPFIEKGDNVDNWCKSSRPCGCFDLSIAHTFKTCTR